MEDRNTEDHSEWLEDAGPTNGGPFCKAENFRTGKFGLDFEGLFRRSNDVVPVRRYELTRLREMFIETPNAFSQHN